MTVEKICAEAREAGLKLAAVPEDTKNRMLYAMADAIDASADEIIAANKIDTENYVKKDTAFLDRLTLNKKRVADISEGVRQVAKLKDPVGEVTAEWTAANGLHIKKVRAPLGVIGVIYEARPNVTVDVAALTVKSGNAVVLRGGKDAINSNRKLFEVMHNALAGGGFIADCVKFIDDVSRESSSELLKQDKYIDVIIPRGGDSLKKFIAENAAMPVIFSAGGNCHVYVDKDADLKKAYDIVKNAKLQRPSVCNAMEHLLVHEDVADNFLPKILKELSDNGVELLGCEETSYIYPCKIAAEEDYFTEFEALKMTSKVVKSADEAISRINKYGTKHSEAIVTEDKQTADKFCKEVDAGAVYVNASTRFTDGFEFGFGAEIAISTQKLHARGPLGLTQLTSEKYVCTGDGLVRK